MAAAGAVALYHARGLTPEADLLDGDGLPTIEYGEAERTQTLQSLDCGETPDIVMIGCPHASLAEIAEVAQMVHGRHLKRPVWVCTSRVMKQAANHAGYTRSIEDAGGRLVADTCMVVAPMEHMGFRVTGVSSGKAACYLPGFCKQQVAFADSRRLVEEALK
jgi:predicted aconitase